MKARILVSILAVVFSIAILNAGNPKTTKYINEEVTETSIIKDYTFVNSETLKALHRITYTYDINGVIQERVYYKWDNEKGWIGIQKHTYEYNADNKVAYLIHTKWDQNNNNWSDNSEYLAHIYNQDGKYLTRESIQVNTNDLAEIK